MGQNVIARWGNFKNILLRKGTKALISLWTKTNFKVRQNLHIWPFRTQSWIQQRDMGLTQYLIMTVNKIIIAKETWNRFIHNDIMCSEKDGRMNEVKNYLWKNAHKMKITQYLSIKVIKSFLICHFEKLESFKDKNFILHTMTCS